MTPFFAYTGSTFDPPALANIDKASTSYLEKRKTEREEKERAVLVVGGGERSNAIRKLDKLIFLSCITQSVVSNLFFPEDFVSADCHLLLDQRLS